MRRGSRVLAGFLVAGLLLFTATAAAGVPRSADLENTTPTGALLGLSLAESRIVLNPGVSLGEPNSRDREDLALDVGYYHGGRTAAGHRLPEAALLLQRAGDGYQQAADVAVSWLPHALPFSGTFPSGTKVTGEDFFYDANTVVRRLATRTSTAAAPVAIAGRVNGPVAWNPRTRVLTVEASAGFAYAVAVPRGGAVRFFASRDDLLAGAATEAEPPVGGYWAVDLAAKARRRSIAIAFATPEEGGVGTAARRALKPAVRGDVAARLSARERAVDALLTRVPRPHDFGLTTVPSYGIGDHDVRLAYYRAWAILADEVLPPTPENDFQYPQLPVGKASLWHYGNPRAPESIGFESLLAIQWLAYVDPETAWSAYQGFMTLVEPDGQLQGEAVPARKAQTARILYELTGDRRKLAEVYPAIRRYLLWAKDNLRWIFLGSYDYPSEMDANFATYALVDMGDAAAIARILGREDEAEFWEAQRDELRERYLARLWPSPDGTPLEFDFGPEYPNCEPRIPLHPDLAPEDVCEGYAIIVAGGLLSLEDGPHARGLVDRVLAEFDPAARLAGFDINQSKYPDTQWAELGLIEHGRRDVARALVNAQVRDATAIGLPAEMYRATADGGLATFGIVGGVGQSYSGVIYFVLQKNGYRAEIGRPAFADLGEGGGGVSNLRIRGGRLDVTIDQAASRAYLSGTAVRPHPACRVVELHGADRVELPANCLVSGRGH